MEKEQILKELDALNSHLVGINEQYGEKERISGNDVYEYVKDMCTYGKLLSQLRKHYDENDYPLLENSRGEVSQATHYDVWRIDQETHNCHTSLKNVQSSILRVDPQFYNFEDFEDFLVELEWRSTVGEYSVPESAVGQTTKMETLARVAGIFYAVVVDKNSGSIDLESLNMLKECYQLYKDEVGVQLVLHGEYKDGSAPVIYTGPQFGNHVESMLERIEKEFVSSNSKKVKNNI